MKESKSSEGKPIGRAGRLRTSEIHTISDVNSHIVYILLAIYDVSSRSQWQMLP